MLEGAVIPNSSGLTPHLLCNTPAHSIQEKTLYSNMAKSKSMKLNQNTVLGGLGFAVLFMFMMSMVNCGKNEHYSILDLPI